MGRGKSYTEAELETVIDMKVSGVKNREIGEALGRSTVSIDAIIYRLRKEGRLPPAYKVGRPSKPTTEKEPFVLRDQMMKDLDQGNQKLDKFIFAGAVALIVVFLYVYVAN